MRKLLCLLLFLVGCTTVQSPEGTGIEEPKSVAATLYMARSSIWKPTEFEQHAIKEKKLLSECGSVKGDRTLVAQQNITTLNDEGISKIKNLAGAFSASISKHGSKFEPAATKERFFDGGKLTLSLSIDGVSTDVETSVDSISEPNTPQEKALSKLVSSLREYSEALCGNPIFFGITKG